MQRGGETHPNGSSHQILYISVNFCSLGILDFKWTDIGGGSCASLEPCERFWYKSCVIFSTGRHCTVLGFANCDQLVSMPRLMDHAKFIHKIACLSVDLHEEFEVKQVIKSETDGQKPVKLARVNWEPVFLFIEGTRHIFQLNTKFFDSNHFPNAKCGCKVGWEMQERSSSGGAYVGRISFIKDSSQVVKNLNQV